VAHFTLQTSPNGPILNALVAVSQARSAALTAADQEIPNSVPVFALVDTGASCTCVDPAVLASLKLTPTGNVSVNTPSTGATPHSADQYDVALIVPAANGPPLIFQTIPVISSDLLSAQGFHALIGRDILDRCVLIYNGHMGQFTLAF
jgi:Aspartyl protease